MSCVQGADSQREIQDMFMQLENGSGEVNFEGFMIHVSCLALICKKVFDQVAANPE